MLDDANAKIKQMEDLQTEKQKTDVEKLQKKLAKGIEMKIMFNVYILTLLRSKVSIKSQEALQ